ncbi:uncharacterized protein LOC111705217 [Eurytemora carolleeae]|uniref:uncharacterized protein LOC111705217 n=1 Tax=Eurytemora carolleeae TaxID=1294199 RepID=UPI000C786E1D|nr:uncharacterized protein LOC111705217 [Eurytemora carolleeae]|eukprot:XP_023333462.1 uncharacterized protein LOC111705217 [Eurytemora affinis]
MPPINDLAMTSESNLSSPSLVIFRKFNFLVFFYMLIILLIANITTCTIRGYRESLPYLRVNIILILNYYLVEIFNAFVSVVCCASMVSSIMSLPYWLAFSLELVDVYLVYLSLGLSTTISVSRLLMIIKFDRMIELEPEQLSQRILGFLVIIFTIIMGFPAYVAYTQEAVSPQVVYYTVWEEPTAPHPYLACFTIVWTICVLTTVGPYLFGKYYLKKYHILRMEFENRDEAKNIINMRSVIKTVLFTSFFVVSIVVLRFFADQSIFPYGLMMGVLVFTMYLVKFSQNPKIKEYFFHKLTQKKTILQENYYTILSSRILNLRANKVGVLN